MSNWLKILLIIATSLLVIGLAICICAIFALDFDFSQMKTYSDYQSKEYITENADYHQINVDDVANDVQIIKSDDDQIHVYYFESINEAYDIDDVNGILTVSYDADDIPFFHWNFSFSDRDTDLIISIPESYIGSLQVETVSGDIEILDMTTDELEISSVSGELDINNTEIDGKFSCETVSGDIELDNILAYDIELSSTSGEISANILGNSGNYRIDCSSVSGDILVDRGSEAAEKRLSAETISGDIDIEFIEY